MAKRFSLREARDRRNFTQEQLETHSGVPQSVISRIESGAVEQPRANTMRLLARALKMSAWLSDAGLQFEEKIS